MESLDAIRFVVALGEVLEQWAIMALGVVEYSFGELLRLVAMSVSKNGWVTKRELPPGG